MVKNLKQLILQRQLYLLVVGGDQVCLIY